MRWGRNRGGVLGWLEDLSLRNHGGRGLGLEFSPHGDVREAKQLDGNALPAGFLASAGYDLVYFELRNCWLSVLPPGLAAPVLNLRALNLYYIFWRTCGVSRVLSDTEAEGRRAAAEALKYSAIALADERARILRPCIRLPLELTRTPLPHKRVHYCDEQDGVQPPCAGLFPHVRGETALIAGICTTCKTGYTQRQDVNDRTKCDLPQKLVWGRRGDTYARFSV
ncbi:hypothetical protein B0H11DRAFT_2262777 [Mycena galericulata]|nr:hypothetical protein B0H11DRAFT_2262777 [Mycena galericulata]